MAALDMLRSAADFQQIQSHSRSRSQPLLLMRYRRNGLDRTRYGISTGRKVGSAVVRNGIRRRLRTILRAVSSDIAPGFDILLAGGLPRRQSLVVTGDPGAGKTVLCSQIAFSFAKAHRCTPTIRI